MSPRAETYLEKMGVNKGSIYVLALMLSGGGFVEKNHSDAVAAIQAQLAEQTTSIALLQQSNTLLNTKLTDVDRDLRSLTRAFDRSSAKAAAVAANP